MTSALLFQSYEGVKGYQERWLFTDQTVGRETKLKMESSTWRLLKRENNFLKAILLVTVDPAHPENRSLLDYLREAPPELSYVSWLDHPEKHKAIILHGFDEWEEIQDIAVYYDPIAQRRGEELEPRHFLAWTVSKERLIQHLEQVESAKADQGTGSGNFDVPNRDHPL